MTKPDQEANVRSQVVAAIRLLQTAIRWKPGKDPEHLQTRLQYDHLPPSTTLADYETIIAGILSQAKAKVYNYVWQEDIYPTVVGDYKGQCWLVMFSLDGLMETAFPPTNPEAYLSDTRFRYVGTIEELFA